MKALQVKCVANEGVIARQQMCIKNMTNWQEQYKSALRSFNQEVKELKEKLEEEGRQQKKDLEAKETAEKELATLLGQVETAKTDAVKEFKDSQAFVDSCAEYYGVGFEDCLKQVKSNYPDLDLAKVSMDAPMPTTPVGDAVPEETDDSTESNQDTQDDNIILAQPPLNPPIVPLTPSANPIAANDLSLGCPRPSSLGWRGPTRPPLLHELRIFVSFLL